MTGIESDIGSKLQHPRRSLGNRHRSQAEKFLKLGHNKKNITWAEQNSRQSILYDFTNPDNWRLLVKIKIMNEDNSGIRSILEDLFAILGRDDVLLEQLQNVNLIDSGLRLLETAFQIDPLDPNEWWEKINQDEIEIEKFGIRLKKLDVKDPRANILFSRRIRRLKEEGYEDLFLDLSKHLLAQRPANYETWIELGKLHERRKEYDKAWFSYDQAQTHFPKSKSRDKFKRRMRNKLEGENEESWNDPKIEKRIQFLRKMEKLTINGARNIDVQEESLEDLEIDIAKKVELMIQEDRLSEAFFLVRRLAAEGNKEAENLVEKILMVMKNE
jgi:tetratricopeptide (TPR) repeat protein